MPKRKKLKPVKPVTERQLTPQQQKFAFLYLQYGSVARASREAGYAYTPGSGSQLLANPRIRRFVEREQQKMFRRLRVSVDRVLADLVTVAEADVGDMYDADGKQLPPDQWPKELRRALGSVDVLPVFKDGKQVGVEYMPRFQDRSASLKLLGTHLKMFAQTVEHSGPSGGPIAVESPKARLLARILEMRAAHDIQTITIEGRRELDVPRLPAAGAQDGAAGEPGAAGAPGASAEPVGGGPAGGAVAGRGDGTPGTDQ